MKTMWGRCFLVLFLAQACTADAMKTVAGRRTDLTEQDVRSLHGHLREAIRESGRYAWRGAPGGARLAMLLCIMNMLGSFSAYRLNDRETYDTPVEVVVEHGSAATVAAVLDHLEGRIYGDGAIAAKNGKAMERRDLEGWGIRIAHYMTTLSKTADEPSLFLHAITRAASDVVALFLERYPAPFLPKLTLHYAAQYGCAETVRLLLKSRLFDPYWADSGGATAFHLAARHGCRDAFNMLRRVCPTDVLDRTNDGNSVLHEAVVGGHVQMARDILIGSAEPCINERNKAGRTPLEEAVRGGDSAMVKLLLADQRLRLYDSALLPQKTVLHDAAECGHDDVVHLLLAHSLFDPSAGDCAGRTPLHEAAEQGHRAVVARLLQDPRCDAAAVTTWGDSACDLARSAGHHKIVGDLERVYGQQVPVDSRKRHRAYGPMNGELEKRSRLLY